ncbi:hypothetical protein J6590_059631 [Homalodisca vitripennis]|nr:hypothetical protein J6590_059631 [Homalodisca vitripennis]
MLDQCQKPCGKLAQIFGWRHKYDVQRLQRANQVPPSKCVVITQVVSRKRVYGVGVVLHASRATMCLPWPEGSGFAASLRSEDGKPRVYLVRAAQKPAPVLRPATVEDVAIIVMSRRDQLFI